MKRILNFYQQEINELENKDSFLLLFLRMTLVSFCIIFDNKLFTLFVPGILFTRVLIHKAYWLVIFSTLFFYYVVLGLRTNVPNHYYVLLSISLVSLITLYLKNNHADWETYLGKTCGWVIGLIFLFAVIGKFLAPEFLEGSMFELFLFKDERLVGLTEFVLGKDSELLHQNQLALDKIYHSNHPENEILILRSNNHLSQISIFLTYWTILIESLVALFFLVPDAWKISKLKDFILILFILSTYPIATVVGFATGLLIYAFAQSYFQNGIKHFYTQTYLVIFLLCSVFYIPYHWLYIKILSFI